MALLDILDCAVDDLLEPISMAGAVRKPKNAAANGCGAPAGRGLGSLRLKRARIRGVLTGRDHRFPSRPRCHGPISLVTDLIADAEQEPDSESIQAVVIAVEGGRAKSRRLAEALAMQLAVLTDGRSQAPRVIDDLLIELRKAGALTISPPACTECGKHLRTLQRRGQDWYCSVCSQETTECAACGKNPALPLCRTSTRTASCAARPSGRRR